MSDRVFSAGWLVVCGFAFIVGLGIESAFNYEPLGPRAYPLLIIGLMVLCVLRLAWRPTAIVAWPSAPVLRRLAAMLGALMIFAVTFEPLGFPVACALLVVMGGYLFGGNWRNCLVLGAISGIGLYLMFDRLLEVTLPLGSLWS